jgi:hypothetical protein
LDRPTVAGDADRTERRSMDQGRAGLDCPVEGVPAAAPTGSPGGSIPVVLTFEIDACVRYSGRGRASFNVRERARADAPRGTPPRTAGPEGRACCVA